MPYSGICNSILTIQNLFDPTMKKKKKKKKVVAFDDDEFDAPSPAASTQPEEESGLTRYFRIRCLSLAPAEKEEPVAETAAAPVEENPDDMFADLAKKKKKKKVTLDLGDDDTATSSPAGEDGEEKPATEDGLDFGDLKKKKKKKKKVDLEAFEAELNEADEGEDGDDPFKTYDEGGAPKDNDEEPWQNSDRDYTYGELLARVFKVLRLNNPELAGEKRRYTIVPPSVHREGNKKSVFANITDICKRMHRQPEHVIQFLFAELGTTGSVDANQHLIIKGRFQQKQIEAVLRRYIVEYVTCKTCKSPDTILTKENRIYFMTCESCGSSRSVSAIKTGFSAQIGKRKH